MSRTGKIARLPREIRDQLNRRLNDGESGVRLVGWLNGLPEVQAMLNREFAGRKINEQNLTEWKAGGYRDWQARQESLAQAQELAADAGELNKAAKGRLTDHLATILAAKYAAALAEWNGDVTDEFRNKLRALRDLCQDIVNLRRGDHSGARLYLEQERLENEREKTEEEALELFQQWANNGDVRNSLHQNGRNSVERECRLRQLFGLPPKAPDAPKGASPPNPDDPNQTKSN